MSEKSFSKQEFESIYLKAAIDSLDSMLTSNLLELRGNDPNSEIYFHEKTHQKYFYIILIDFLSESSKIFNDKGFTCLELIKNISETPCFEINNSALELKKAINIFYSWLDEEITVKVYLSEINKEYNLKLKRKEFIKICANISKHNFTRLTSISEDIRKIFKRIGVDISFHDSLLILDDFYERFHNDILIYHGSNIVEMINNIRWGIHEYLLPEFIKSYKKDTSDPRGLSYEYSYPKNIKDEFAKNCYWSLMNFIRRKPHIKKFKSTKWLKLRY